MQIRLLTRLVILLALAASLVFSQDDSSSKANINRKVHPKIYNNENYQRARRAVVHKPGFFRTLFSVIYDQWNDTKNTINTIRTMVNGNFADENEARIETTTSSDPNATTTEAPYKITRTELNRIIRRNIKGLVRLYNIELRDALAQSNTNYADFKKNASSEVSKFL